METNNKIEFRWNMIKHNGKKVKVWYSSGKLSGHPEGAMTIYAREYGQEIPTELNPENDTDSQTDYFDKDRVRIEPTNEYYKQVMEAYGKQQEHRFKIYKKKAEQNIN